MAVGASPRQRRAAALHRTAPRSCRHSREGARRPCGVRWTVFLDGPGSSAHAGRSRVHLRQLARDGWRFAERPVSQVRTLQQQVSRTASHRLPSRLLARESACPHFAGFAQTPVLPLVLQRCPSVRVRNRTRRAGLRPHALLMDQRRSRPSRSDRRGRPGPLRRRGRRRGFRRARCTDRRGWRLRSPPQRTPRRHPRPRRFRAGG